MRNAHSVPLEFLSETGLIGAVLALGGLALLVAAAIRARARGPGRERGFAVALLAALLAASVHLWVDWDWEIPGVMMFSPGVLGGWTGENGLRVFRQISMTCNRVSREAAVPQMASVETQRR